MMIVRLASLTTSDSIVHWALVLLAPGRILNSLDAGVIVVIVVIVSDAGAYPFPDTVSVVVLSSARLLGAVMVKTESLSDRGIWFGPVTPIP